MATVNKDFKIKSGLIVEGTTATVNGHDILTKKQADQDYIVGLIGGTATSANTANTVVKRDANGNFAAGTITADLTGDVTGQVSDISNHSTSNLSEGTNLYFTDARAVTANTGLWDTIGAASAAQAAAELTASNALTAAVEDLEAYADQAEADARAYTDQEVAALVNGAPELLDTLNELAAAIGNDESFSTTLTTLVGTKADTSYVDAEISDLNTAAQGYATTAEANAIAHADALDTDDIAEGVNQYFTDARAKTSAADLLTGASLTNITITGTGSGLTITAENGVADSDTDDLVEGTTNKYFTDARAVDALEAVVPNFTSVEINSVAKQVAATLSAPTAGIQLAHAFFKADYRSAEYLVKVAYGTHTEISKVLLTLDSSDNIAITEYGIVGTNGSASTISAGISGTNVQLQVTTTNNDSTVTVVGTLLK